MINRKNYLWMKKFLTYLSEVKGLKPKSLKRYEFLTKHLLIWADETSFSEAMSIQPALQKYARELPNQNGAPLADATVKRILQLAKRFFTWGKTYLPADFRKVSPAWVDALELPGRIVSQQEHVYVTLDEMLILSKVEIKEGDLAMQRDRAAAALLFLSGARASAFTTFPIKAVDLTKNCIYQWPKEYGVETKNSKKSTTFLLPIPELLAIVAEWDFFVREKLPEDSPWYAPVQSEWGQQTLSTESPGKHRNVALNKRLRLLYAAAELPYKSAHKFRHGHAVFGLQQAQTMADYKAISMNLMHEDITVTDGIYARLLSDEVASRIARLHQNKDAAPALFSTGAADTLSNEELAVMMKVVSERLMGQTA